MDSQKNWIRSTACLLSLLGLPVAGWADCNSTKDDKANSSQDKYREITPSARGCINRVHGPFITADFIYWEALEDQIVYGIKQNTTTSDGVTHLKQRIEQPHFRFRPGFKVGLGYNLPYDGWDLYANWTWLHARKTTRTGASEGILNPFDDAASADTATVAQARFRFKYNTLDLELGRSMFLSRKLSIRPQVGLRGASIDQDVLSRYSGLLSDPTEVTKAKQKSDFFAIGPRFGIQTRYGSKWSVFGAFDFALLYGKRDISLKAFNVTDEGDQRILSINGDKHRVRPNAQLQLGFDWGTCFCQNRYINIGASYESQYWWSQFEAPSPQNPFPQGDLVLHGLTVHARFDY